MSELSKMQNHSRPMSREFQAENPAVSIE